MDWTEATKELTKPLDSAAVKPPPKGKFGEYVDGLHVINEANRIFGHDGWSYSVTRLESQSHEVFTLKDKNGQEYVQVRVCYLCSVLVVVGGTTRREGVAVGTGSGKPENVGDVIESAVKEAETDALKRALRTFGNTFGLALYEKDKGARQVADLTAVGAAIAAIECAMNGRELKLAIESYSSVQGVEAVAIERVERLKTLLKGAPLEALSIFEKTFAPDWAKVAETAKHRKHELTQQEAA